MSWSAAARIPTNEEQEIKVPGGRINYGTIVQHGREDFA
jgi:hypothetical protein